MWLKQQTVSQLYAARYTHLVAINAYMASNGYTIWWRENKSPLVIPQCAISEGQGTVHFPEAEGRKKKQMKDYFMQLQLPEILSPCAYFYKLNPRQICVQGKMKVGAKFTAHGNSHKSAKKLNSTNKTSVIGFSLLLR